MNIFSPKGWHSRGYLPHFDGGEIPQFITFRLHDSLPRSLLEKWRQELAQQKVEELDKKLRRQIEIYLDQGHGCAYLKDSRIASLVQDALLHFDGNHYRLTSWVVMPNHIHLLLTPCFGYSLARIIQSLKGYTAYEANKILNRKGVFWMADYFDRFIRDDQHFAIAIAYIENNPVKAGLCADPCDWQWSSASFRAQKQ